MTCCPGSWVQAFALIVVIFAKCCVHGSCLLNVADASNIFLSEVHPILTLTENPLVLHSNVAYGNIHLFVKLKMIATLLDM
jgi:hypothetical protein